MIARLIPLLLLFIFSPSWSENPKSPFAIAVVPTQSYGEGGTITMAHVKTREFFVVLTNVSTKPQAVFEAWNSWGYQTISFEFTRASGKKVVVSARQRDFTRNFPSTFTIQPGEHQVFAVRLDQYWEAKPALPKLNEMPITLRAIYEVLPSPEGSERRVWTGRLKSHEYKLTLRQW